LGVAKNVATPTPSPVKPVVGRPVQFARLPDDGVPRIGVISVGDVANTALPVPVSSVIAFLSSADVVISVLLLKFIVLFVSVCGAVVVTTSMPAICKLLTIVYHVDCSSLNLIVNELPAPRDRGVPTKVPPLPLIVNALIVLG
jgi:hypothetical protein